MIFFFSCLRMVICDLMLLELGDLLWSSMLKNFFTAARSIFSCKYFSCFLQYIWTLRNQLKILLSGLWVGGLNQLTIKLFHLSTKLKLKLKFIWQNHDDFKLVSEPPDILNKTDKTFPKKYWPCHTKKNSFSNTTKENHLILKASGHKLPSSNNWKRKLYIKYFFRPKNNLSVRGVFLWPAL